MGTVFALQVDKSDVFDSLQQAVIEASEKVKPAVGHIEAFQRHQQKRRKITGSCILVNKDGIILTNAHVVQNAEKITVVVPGNKHKFKATVVGTDRQTDLAVIRIKPDEFITELDFPILGDSDAIKVGQWVIAIGNPWGLDGTVSLGIISAKGRNLKVGNISQFIQTDAMIDPGSSGGPLINLDGEVIGINTLAQGRGIGFTIPINQARKIMNSFLEAGKVERSWLGVTLQPFSRDFADYFDMPDQTGVIVNWTVNKSPADKAGIKPGDIIVSFAGKKVESENEQELKNFIRMVSESEQGKQVKIGIVRAGKRLFVYPELAPQPMMDTDEVETEYGFNVKEVTHKIFISRMLESTDGVFISFVDRDSPASEAGLAAGDIITSLGGIEIKNMEDFERADLTMREAERFLIKYKRGRDLRFALVKKRG
jgi:serine protease Do